ncbi:MAG: hypothetical protein ACE5GM_02580 [bacterium]
MLKKLSLQKSNGFSESRYFFVLLICLVVSFPALSRAEQHDDDGIKEESAVSVLNQDDQENELIQKLKVFGWLDTTYKDNTKKNNKQYFDSSHLYLILDAQISDRWRAFAEMEYEHAPDTSRDNVDFDNEKYSSTGKVLLERSYIEYNLRDEAQFRAGKYNTPLGIWTPAHWSIYVDTTAKPIHEAKHYVSSKQVGAQFFGNAFPSDMLELNYSAYTSNGSEQRDQFGSNKPSDDKLAYGSDMRVKFMEDYMFGYSFNHTKATVNYPAINRVNKTHMVYSDLLLPSDVVLRGAYFYQVRDHGYDDIETYYAKIKYSFMEKWYINYRLERGDLESSGKRNNRETANVMTLAYWPLTTVRTRLEFVTHRYQKNINGAYNEWSAWIGILF